MTIVQISKSPKMEWGLAPIEKDVGLGQMLGLYLVTIGGLTI